MKVFSTISEIQDYLSDKIKIGKSIGFVPTMGALHEGHLSLIREARAENDIVVSSIFVNPIQFNKADDLKNYPRNTEEDKQMLSKEKCNILFLPSVEEMYPEPVNEQYDFGNLDKVMEGLHRPGHFNGVAIVVKRLFEIVKPTRAYFGMKDYQQMVIIHHMVKTSNLPVEIVPCSIIREDNGLAMSSRNRLLSETEKMQASILYDALKLVKTRSGYDSISEIKREIEYQFKKNKYISLEYFEIVDMYTLKPLKIWAESRYAIACIAANVGKVRLIDNYIIFS